MSALGLEPRTNGLKGHCSSIELRARVAPGGVRAEVILSWAVSRVNVIYPEQAASNDLRDIQGWESSLFMNAKFFKSGGLHG